jgi:hypothetical protein
MAKKDDEVKVTTWIPPQHDHGTPEPAVEVVTEESASE